MTVIHCASSGLDCRGPVSRVSVRMPRVTFHRAMDVLDLITSSNVLNINVDERADPQFKGDGSSADYESRWKALKKVIRAENAKKQPCSATLKNATDELRNLRRLLAQPEQSTSCRRPLVTCLDNTAPEPSPKPTKDWAYCHAWRKRRTRRRRFVFYMPAGREVGTDVTIGRERLERIHKNVNKNTYGPLDNGPTVSIAGVPQPMDRFNNRRRR